MKKETLIIIGIVVIGIVYFGFKFFDFTKGVTEDIKINETIKTNYKTN
ncbi:hypothetical protein [Tenacibaculum amylolyticum]